MKTVELPEDLHAALLQEADEGGFPTVADLLADRHRAAVLAHRRTWFAEVDRMREELKERVGVQPSCVDLIREDRNR